MGKPNPMMFRSAMNKIGAHSENTAMIGDRMDTDIIAGIEAGLHTILVLTGISDHAEIAGPVTLAAPEVSDNRELMVTLQRAVGAKLALPAFRWMLEPAMWLLRTEPELVLKSRWVRPERLLQAGYEFRWPSLAPAVRDVARRR